jgi:hypothetical protein
MGGALIGSLAVTGIGAHASAQEAVESFPASAEPPLPETVPTYESPAYELSPIGAERRSEALHWPNTPLLVTSSVVFTAAYVPGVLVAAFRDQYTTDNLYIPVAGPWLELARESATKGNQALLSIGGVFQGLGALGMLVSFVVPERKTSNWYLIGNKRLAIAPTPNPLSYGLSAQGQF